MKCFNVLFLLILVLIPITVLSTQSKWVEAAPSLQIMSITSIDQWGIVNSTVFRGFQENVILTINSNVPQNYEVYATLIDINNVPVGFAAGNFFLNGTDTITLNMEVSDSAFVGVGNFSIVITDSTYSIISTCSKAVLIGILGDFNGDGKVDVQDLTRFSSAFIYYNQYQTIPPYYQCCDFNRDGKIDVTDLTIFATAYIAYWNA